MGKKRVHELAKEYQLENKEVIALLQAAGFSVKTHSSSVLEEEAAPILKKRGKKQEEKETKPARRPGMMIVRKKAAAKKADQPVETEKAEEDTQKLLAEEAKPEASVTTPIEEQQAIAAEGKEHVESLQQMSETKTKAASKQSAADKAQEGQTRAEAKDQKEQVASADGSQPSTAESKETKTTERHTKAKTQQKPKETGAKVVRMIDREKLLERVPQRRLGGTAPKTPAQKFGKVTELQVVVDPYGRGREMVDVGKDKKSKSSKPGRRMRAPTKQEMMELRERAAHPSRLRKKKVAKQVTKKTEVTQPKASKCVIRMKETIAVGDFAKQMGVKAKEILHKLFALDVMATVSTGIDHETAQLVAQDYGYTVECCAFEEASLLTGSTNQDCSGDLCPRPPVVTVMGHVDHGKTSLLDTLRKARVAQGEAGGITQHIGAYQVEVPGKKGLVTFLDTPGHAAFTTMRARGAQVTDIVVLVVAADDGVMPQTEEAIQHAKAAKVPIIVAINKIDKAEANVDRVLQNLSKFELIPESWGGDTLMVQTSATKNKGIKELLETILLQAEMLELKANPKRPASGTVIEAKLDKGRGAVATVLVQNGSLKKGDPIVIGEGFGKVRSMSDGLKRNLTNAGPSAAVEITGLDVVPEAGDTLHVVKSLDDAKQIIEHRRGQARSQELSGSSKMSLEDLMARMQGQEKLELNVVLKADVRGSVEAVRQALEKLSNDEVSLKVMQAGVGGIKESDIMLATASQAVLIGFGVRPDANARKIAEREGVEIRTYRVIYELLDDMKKAMEGLLAPQTQEKIIGRADVREVFKITKVGTVAGCRVVSGKAMRAARIRVLRDDVQVYDGRVASLKHFKEDVREVDHDQECGVSVEGYHDIKQGDALEFYELEEVARTLEDAAAASARRAQGPEPAHP